jgi:hypothetical protein
MEDNIVPIRIFLFPAFRPNGLASLRSILDPPLLQQHGRKCSWSEALIICHELKIAHAGFLVAGTLGASRARQNSVDILGSILEMPLTALQFSVRALNCFDKARISTLGDLVSTTPEALLRYNNFGRKSLNEIIDKVADLGFTLGMNVDDLRRSLAQANTAFQEIDIRCLVGMEQLGIGDLSSALGGIEFVGELTRIPEPKLREGFSERKVQRIFAALQSINGSSPIAFQNWSRSDLCDLAQIFSSELKRYLNRLFLPLDFHIVSRFRYLKSRHKQIAARFFGVDGTHIATLEQIGQEFGVTRERIRQLAIIASRLMTKPPLPQSLHIAVRMIENRTPALADDIERELAAVGVTSQPIHLDAIHKIAEQFGIVPNFIVRSYDEKRYVIKSSDEDVVERILGAARRRISHYGMTSIRHVQQEVAETEDQVDEEMVWSFVELLDGRIWLNDERTWFWSVSVPRNSVVSRARKAVWVAERISIQDLREAVLRDIRMADVDLPPSIFQTWCSTVPEFELSNDGSVSPSASWQDAPSLTEAETLIVQRLSHADFAVHLSELRQLCASESQYSNAACDRTVFCSPVLKALGGGFYSIVGSSSEHKSIPEFARKEPLDQSFLQHAESGNPVGPVMDSFDSSTHLIADLDPKSPNFIRDAANRMIKRAHQLELMKSEEDRWSLIELDWSHADLSVLRRWASQAPSISRAPLSFDSEQMDVDQAIALVFLAHSADVGRNRASEGELWSFVAENTCRELREAFFTLRIVPKQWLHDATQDACRRFQIRNVFGKEGALSGIRTVYLQFGITFAGVAKIPHFFSGGKLPVSIFDLLEDPQLHSESFVEGWQILQGYRRSICTFAEASESLARNPWFKDFGECILHAGAQRTQVMNDEPEPALEDLFTARVFWRGIDPEVVVDVGSQWPGELQASEYVLQIDDQLRTSIRRDGEGHYGSHVPLRIPLESSEVSVSILDTNGQTIARLMVPFFEPDDEVLAFSRESGLKLDLWGLRPSQPIILACRSDLSVSVAPDRFRRVLESSWILYDFGKGCPPECRVQVEGEILWQMPTADPMISEPRTRSYEVVLPGGRFGDSVLATTHSQLELPILALVLNDRTIRRTGGAFRVELRPMNYQRASAAIIVEKKGQVRKIPAQLTCNGDVWGVALKTGKNSWQAISDSDLVEAESFSTTKVLAVPPSRWKGEAVRQEDWALMEGNMFCARPRKAPITGLRSIFAGVGEPLRFLLGPYNATDEGVRVAHSIIDSGIISDVKREGTEWRIGLRNGVNLGSDHEVWCWRRGSLEPVSIEFSSLAREQVSVAGISDAQAFAVSYKGRCLGSRFASAESMSGFAEIIAEESWIQISPWLRWWRMPLLLPSIKNHVEHCIRRNRVSTFNSWAIIEEHNGLPFPEDLVGTDGWSVIIRTFYWDWLPETSEAGRLLRDAGLLSGDPQADVASGWAKAMDYCALHPVLLVLFAKRGLYDIYPAITRPEAQVLLAMLANTIAGIPRNSGLLAPTRQALLIESASQMSVDPVFIQRVLLREALSIVKGLHEPTENLKIALNVQPFRRWLVLELLLEDARM